MSSTEPRLILAVADDLTGAVEAGRALASRSRVDLGLCATSQQVAASATPRAATSCTVLDLDCRNLDAETAHRSVAARTAWFLAGQSPQTAQTARGAQELRGPRNESEKGSNPAGATPPVVAFLKIDSLLRGPVGAVIEAVLGEPAGAPQRVPVICPAVPALGRAVVAGSVLVQGRPLAEVDAWNVERTGAPATVADALHRPTHLVHAADLADPAAAALLLEAAQRDRAALVVDASTEADLDVVAAACSTDARALPVGAVALAAALGRRWDPHWDPQPSAPAGEGLAQDAPGAAPGAAAGAGESTSPRRVLIVVGTMEPSARRQVQHVEQAGRAQVVVVQEKLSAVIDAVQALAHGPVVLTTPEPEGPADPTASQVLAGAAAELATHFHTDLIVLGGHTARQVCAALGVHSLDLGPQVATGAVISTTASGRRIITRPGSFGTTRALSDLLDALTHSAPTTPSTTSATSSTAPSTPPALSTPSDRRSQP